MNSNTWVLLFSVLLLLIGYYLIFVKVRSTNEEAGVITTQSEIDAVDSELNIEGPFTSNHDENHKMFTHGASLEAITKLLGALEFYASTDTYKWLEFLDIGSGVIAEDLRYDNEQQRYLPGRLAQETLVEVKDLLSKNFISLDDLRTLDVGDRVRKVGGNYQANGVIKALWQKADGTFGYVFEFDDLPGMIHIFNGTQLEAIESEA